MSRGSRRPAAASALLVAMSAGNDAGAGSFANAFGTGLRPGRTVSVTRASAEALIAKANALTAAFGGEGRTMVLNVADATVDGFGEVLPSLAELLDQSVAELGK